MARKARKDDIPVTDPVDSSVEAGLQANDMAALLRAQGKTDQFGVFVAKNGKGFSVFLRNRDNDSFDVSDK